MTDYRVTGYPLPEEGIVLEVEAQYDELLVSEEDAARLIQAWVDGPRRSSDVVRESRSTDDGTYIMALHMDGEINIEIWSDYDSGIYDLTSSPFDFEYTEIV